MANNVYIGMRYVPLFDGAWNATKSYEALTIVEYGNNTYTSKKPVPVGTLPTNTNYWALTGNYNGQISNLQTQIDDINDEIDALDTNVATGNYFKGKKIVVYGDSISDRTNAYTHNLVNDYGLDVTNRAVAGSFLTTPAASGYTPGVTLINNASDLASFDIALIQYGTNDWQLGRNPLDFKAAVKSVIDKFRGIKCEPIFILPPYGKLSSGALISHGYTIESYIDYAIDACIANNIKYINLHELFPARKGGETPWLENQGFYLHPSDMGAALIARIIVSGQFNTGKCFDGHNDISRMLRQTDTTDIGIMPATYHNLRGNLLCRRSDINGGMSVASVANGLHRFRFRGTLRTNDSNGISIRVAGTNSSVTAEGYLFHNGDTFDIYDSCDGDGLFVGMWFQTTGVNTLWSLIENFSLEIDEVATPRGEAITTTHSGVTIKNEAKCTVDNWALYIDPIVLDCANGVSAGQPVAIVPFDATEVVMTPCTVYDTSSPAEPFKEVSIFFRNHNIYCNESISNGAVLNIVIPPLINRPYAHNAIES